MIGILRTPDDWPRILTARADATDPVDLDAAKQAGAFEGLRKAIRDLGPTGTIVTVGAANLRGRGGGGYPAADKWRACAQATAPRRYVVANGYGADPGSQTDLVLLQRDPYAVLEGMAIAALSVGAGEAILAVRAEQTELVAALEHAIAAAEHAGLLGQDILSTGRSVDVSVRPVQGAYMLGEETVLLKALEGRRGQPEQRPPYPETRGLFRMPTVVHNVQTLAAVPWIVRNGAEAFAAVGAPGCPGTVLVHVRGPEHDGVAEVPTGTPLSEIVALGGRQPAGRKLKAALVGGPTGGLLPPGMLDVAFEYESLRAAGAHMGSGSVVVADDRACVVDLARLLTRFCADSACGKTIPCRIGTRRLVEIGDRFASGRAQPTDLTLLDDLSHDIAASALCDHERLATLPLQSVKRYFQPELDEHILHGVCPAGVCQPIALAATGATS
jgi:NADH:ubiquinone oxidoreductase subunit F (NADH-binding)